MAVDTDRPASVHGFALKTGAHPLGDTDRGPVLQRDAADQRRPAEVLVGIVAGAESGFGDEALALMLVSYAEGRHPALAARDYDIIQGRPAKKSEAMLRDFLDFNDFLDEADGVLQELDLEGEFQIASFHPEFQFAGTAPDDITNFTNRSPYPTLHLLREASIDRAVAACPDAEAIYGRNVETLRALGREGWRRLGWGRRTRRSTRSRLATRLSRRRGRRFRTARTGGGR